IGRERPREPDALLHAAGELAAIALGPLREPDERQLLLDDAPALLGRVAPQLEPEADVVAHRPPRQQAELLEHHGDAQAANAAQRRRIAVHPDVDGRVAVAHQHLAAGDEVHAVRRGRQRRVAGPRPAAWSAGRQMRSSTMASSTITKPASKPMPTWTVLSARTTGTPSPPAPTSAAITTMERLSMMH